MILYALAWASAAGDASGLGRAAIRLGGMLVVAYGLWRAARWAWWLGVAACAVLAVAGAASLVAMIGGHLPARPNPALDLAFFAGSTLALAAALVLLLLPAARRTVKAPPPP